MPPRRSRFATTARGQTGGVVLHANGLSRLVDLNAANAVDLFEIAQRKHRGLRGLLLIAEQNIDICHRAFPLLPSPIRVR